MNCFFRNLKLLSSTFICVFATGIISSSAIAKDRIDLDEASIQGASELPKVLYIVPWKKGVIDNKPVKMSTMVDEVMAPVDRVVLKRQIKFYEDAQPEVEGSVK